MTGMEHLNNVMKTVEDSKEVKYTAFNNMDFSNTELKNLKFVKCNFNGADFSNAKLYNVEFENCTGNNAIFNNADIDRCTFDNSRFDNANFRNAMIVDYSDGKTWNDIENSSFKSASFDHAIIEGINIGDSDFKNANFKLAELRFDEISNSDFRQANLCSKFETTRFKDTNLENTGLDNIESYKDSGVLLVDGKMRNPTNKDYIDKKDFLKGYDLAKEEGVTAVEFMQTVIEHHGADDKILREAANDIADIEKKEEPEVYRLKYIHRLLEDVKNTDTYKNRVNRDNIVADKEYKEYMDELKKSDEDYLKDIKLGNYTKAYSYVLERDGDKDLAQKIFMNDVINEHGTKDSEIEFAVDAVAYKENMSIQEKVKLLEATMKTDAYKQAFDKEQGKTQEAVNAR